MTMTAPDVVFEPGLLNVNDMHYWLDLGRSLWVRPIDLKTVYMMTVIKQSLGSWSHMWNLGNVSRLW